MAKGAVEWESIANILNVETDIHVLAQSLSNFFKQLFKTKQCAWAKKLNSHIAFPICTRDVVCRAFLYGERQQAMQQIYRRTPRMQTWMKWVLPLFDCVDTGAFGDEEPFDTGGDLIKGEHPAAAKQKSSLIETQAILLVVSVLHYSFRIEPSDRFGSILSETQRRFEAQGWNETNSDHMGSILKAFIRKIAKVDGPALKKDAENPAWDKLLVLSAAAEEFVFFSPLYGLEVRPDAGVVGIHPAQKGCADRELIATFHEVLQQLGVSNQAISSEVFQDPQAAKEYKKRKELLAGMGQFWSTANKWSEALEKQLETGRGSKAEAKLDPLSMELGELMARRVSRCKKKQAIQALQFAATACRNYQHLAPEMKPKSGDDPQWSDDLPSWTNLSAKSVLEQITAGGFHLRRLTRTLDTSLEAFSGFVAKAENTVATEAKKCYFAPSYLGPGPYGGLSEGVPRDGMPEIVEASSLVLNLTNLVAVGAKNFVQEVQTEILNPLNELKAEYDEAANTFKMHCAQVEKDLERERELLVKDHAACERDLVLVNSVETQKDKGEKRVLMAQRTVARFVRYEQLHANFEQSTVPTAMAALQQLIYNVQLVELKRLACTQVCLHRYMSSFARFMGGQSPLYRRSASMIEALDPYLAMECFGMKEAPAVAPTLPKLSLSAAALLEKLALEEKATEQPSVTPSSGVCSCGTPIDFDFQFCIECGARVTPGALTIPPKPDPPSAAASDGKNNQNILARMKAPLNVSAIQSKLKTTGTTTTTARSPKHGTLEFPLKTTTPPPVDAKTEEVKASIKPITPRPSPAKEEPSLAALAVQQKMKARLEALERAEAAKAAEQAQTQSPPRTEPRRVDSNADPIQPGGADAGGGGGGGGGGKHVRVESTVLPPPTSDPRCPSCHTVCPSESRFCVECGSPIMPTDKKARPPPVSRKFAPS